MAWRRSRVRIPYAPPKQDNPNHIFSIGDGFGFCFIIDDFQSSRKHVMKKLLSCEFNVDTARVELKYSDSSMLSIDCDGVEDEYAKTIRQRSALDYLVYNAPLEYAELVLCGDVEGYLRNVTDYRSFNEWE